MDRGLAEQLLAKLPAFNPEWGEPAQASYFAALGRIVGVIGDVPPAPVPEVAKPHEPVAMPIVAPHAKRSTRAIGTTEAQKNIMRRVAAAGGTNVEAGLAAGVPTTTAAYYMTTFRNEAGVVKRGMEVITPAPIPTAQAPARPAPIELPSDDAGFRHGPTDMF